MKSAKPAFKVFGVPVFLPPSAGFGVLLVSFFALPSAESVLALPRTSPAVWLLALAHGLALYLVILLHEIGHVVAAKRYGYPVVNVVLHIIGGHTAFRNQFTRARHQFFVAIMGPVFTLIPGVFALGVLSLTANPIVQSLATWVLWAAVIGGLLNMLPGLPLDGGSALSALVWARSKKREKGQLAAAYGGLVISALWIFFPYIAGYVFGFQPDVFDIFLAWFIGTWLAFQAWSQIQLIKRGALSPSPEQTGADWQIKVRRAIAVDESASCAEAITGMEIKRAGSVIVTKSGEIVGLVINSALMSVPETSRSTTSVSTVARRVFKHDYISKEIPLSDYKLALISQGNSGFIVLDEFEKIYGVAFPEDQEI